MKTKHFLSTAWLWSLVLILSACSEENQTMPGSETDQALVSFTASIEGETRATDTDWEIGDAIGVFMTKAGTALSNESIVDEANNRMYTTSSSDGKFLPTTGQSIFYPTDGSKVDFTAYYPYKEILDNFQYPVDVTDQSKPAELDLMYANNVREVGKGNTNRLIFDRQLASIKLNITMGKGITSLNGLKVNLTGLPTRAAFSLAEGTLTADKASVANIAMRMETNATAATASAILLPIDSWKGVTLVFTLDGKSYTVKMDNASALSKGKRLVYNVVLKNTGGTIDPTPSDEPTWFETPTLTTNENLVYITHYMPEDKNVRNYSMLYDKENKLAYWVAYPMHRYYLGSTKRTDKWGWDPKIESQWQPCLFKGFSGSNIDRGHQIPSADRTSSYAANVTTFYFTNMTAQVGQGLNQSIWANLENQVRTWTNECDTLYVVTGAMITTKTNQTITYVTDNDREKVAKPKYYFKALCKKKGTNYYTIGFRFNNERYDGTNYNNYRVTVSELEEETGFTFFPKLSKAEKGQIVNAQW